jgi:hypothetical protein
MECNVDRSRRTETECHQTLEKYSIIIIMPNRAEFLFYTIFLKMNFSGFTNPDNGRNAEQYIYE